MKVWYRRDSKEKGRKKEDTKAKEGRQKQKGTRNQNWSGGKGRGCKGKDGQQGEEEGRREGSARLNTITLSV